MTKKVCDLCHKEVLDLSEVLEVYRVTTGTYQVREVCGVCTDLLNERVTKTHREFREKAIWEVQEWMRKLSYERKVNSR